MPEYEIDMDEPSSPYQSTLLAPPPPPPPKKEKQNPSDVSFDIEKAISGIIIEQIHQNKSFGTSVLQGVKRYIVPIGTMLDIVSSFFRVLTLGFLIALPELYSAIFYPIQWYDYIIHYVILITSMIGVALGIPVALFSAVYSLVTINSKLEASMHIKSKKIKNERIGFFTKRIKVAWGYILIAFFCLVLTSVPYVLAQNKDIPEFIKHIIAEIIFILVPAIAGIITMITERESGADIQERSAQVGSAIAMYNTLEAGKRLANGVGTYRDSAAIRGSVDGDISPSLEAGVMEEPDITYMSLSEIAERLGKPSAKTDPFRRTLNNIVSPGWRSGKYGIIKHPTKGYLVPETQFLALFDKYTHDRTIQTTVTERPKVVPFKPKKTSTPKKPGVLRRLYDLFMAPGETPAHATQPTTQNEEKIG